MPVSIPTKHVPIIAATSPRASATMPFRAANWNRHGAWNDSFRYAFSGDWEFPFSTGHIDRVEVCSQGRIIPYYGSSNVIARVGVPLEIVNPITFFGCGPTDHNSYIFSWTNAVVGRVLHEDVANAETMDASIELFRNGDIAVTTNCITTLIPRIHPSDTDGGGIPDVIDPNPGVWDGDFFGPNDELPQGANANAYCWVDVVVSNADAEVLFTGDGPSDLPKEDALPLLDRLIEMAIEQLVTNANKSATLGRHKDLFQIFLCSFITSQGLRANSFEEWDKVFRFFAKYTDEITAEESRIKELDRPQTNLYHKYKHFRYLQDLQLHVEYMVHNTRTVFSNSLSNGLTEEQRADVIRRLDEVKKYTVPPPNSPYSKK